MSTVKANTIEPASGGTVTITGAALTTPALGTPASGTLTNCTGLPASAVVNTPSGGISATTVQAALNELDTEKFAKAGGTITGTVSIVHATDTGNSIILRNTSADGYGLFSQGGYGLRYAAQFVDKDESQLMLLSGTGALTVAQGGTFGGHILPAADNSIDCGSNSRAIKQIYTNNSVIVTSDARLKTARPYNTKERAVARRCRDLGVVYQWNDAIAQKGVDRARMHFGTTVQSVIAAFEAEGLDPMRYGVVCYDEWQAELIEHPAIEAREAYTETVREAGNRYSLRLDQLAFFIATAGA